MIYFIDTNIFLRTFIKEDVSSFESCQIFLKKIKTGQIKAATSGLVIAEVGWTLGSFYKQSKDIVEKSLRSIIKLNNLKIVDKTNWVIALDIFQSKNIKLIDAAISSQANIQEKKWSMVTYDRDFKKIDILSLTPEEI